MNKETVTEQLKEFWHELDDPNCKNIVNKWGTGNISDLTPIIQTLYPQLDMVDEFIMQLEDIEYAGIKLPKYTVINGIPNINNYEEEGSEYKLNSFYKELRDKLRDAPEEQFALEFVIQSIFAHFISKYNSNVIKCNEYKEIVEQYKTTTDVIMNMYGLLKTPEERMQDFFNSYAQYSHEHPIDPREYQGFVYIAKQMNEPDIYKIGMSTDLENRERTFRTGNIYIKIIASVPHDFPNKLENSLHKLYKDKNVAGEWFRFTDEELLDIIETYGFMQAIED
jgi:hypothetical protein